MVDPSNRRNTPGRIRADRAAHERSDKHKDGRCTCAIEQYLIEVLKPPKKDKS